MRRGMVKIQRMPMSAGFNKGFEGSGMFGEKNKKDI
jgi:hypothetical protein